jgi:hypothetical protein
MAERETITVNLRPHPDPDAAAHGAVDRTLRADRIGKVTPDRADKVTADREGRVTVDKVTADKEGRVTADKVTADREGRVTPDRAGKVTPDKGGKVIPDRVGKVTPDKGDRVTPDRVMLMAVDVSKPDRVHLTALRAALTGRPATARRVTVPRAAQERDGRRRQPLRPPTTRAR